MKKMKTKSSKKILPATVFALIIVLSAFAVMCTTVSASEGSGSPGGTPEEVSVTVTEIDSSTTVLAPATVVKVAVPQGAYWTAEVVNYLNSSAVPDKSATAIPENANLSILRNYDALVVYGNVPVNGSAVHQWVNEGGRLVITPWSLTNNWLPSIGFTAAEPSLPAYNPYCPNHAITDVYRNNPLNITLLLPNHPMVKDKEFENDSVGYERGSIAKTNATEIARWNDAYDSTAITCWEYGDGVVVYLNMHYITGDCDRAIWYGWGKDLLVNSIQSPCEIISLEKDYRYTNVCFEKDNDGDGYFNEDPVDYYYLDNDGDGRIDEDPVDLIDNDGDGRIDEDPVDPIDNDGDGLYNEDDVDCPGGTSLGERLPTDADGNYTVEAVVKKNGKVSSYNPGQYYAVSTVNVLVDVDELTIEEDWSDCENISALNPANGGGSVVIVEIRDDGEAYQIFDAKSDNVTVDVSGCIATATLGDVSAGTTILMYVKFGPAQKHNNFKADICENTNAAWVSIGDWISDQEEASAILELIEKV